MTRPPVSPPRLPDNMNSTAGLTPRTERPKYAQRSLIVGLLLAFMLVMWSVQLFLLMTALDSYLAHQGGILWPAALGSIFFAVINLALVRMIPRDSKREV